MILIGQFDSPFVRRVAIALEIYGMAYEHRPWSTFGDGELIAPYNPLRRVPTLVLDSGESLIESTVILDYLDELAGSARALIPEAGPARRAALRICALATGLNDKAVGLVYERVLHQETSGTWIQRCETQIKAVLELSRPTGGAGARLTGLDRPSVIRTLPSPARCDSCARPIPLCFARSSGRHWPPMRAAVTRWHRFRR